MSLAGKRVLIAISGGIAAYKIAELIRLLVKSNAEVRVVLTQSAKAFVSPLTLQVLSGNAVADELFDPDAELAMSHIELAKWADLILVAPATANIIAKLACGIADDLLTTLCLASPASIAIAPAMNQQMFLAKITQENLLRLQKRDYLIWGPDSGEQACGDVGPGRMLEPQALLTQIEQYFTPQTSYSNLHIVITAGPTREALDPVRYITNHSSGKMGFALAQAAKQLGAKVTLITGPVALATPVGIERIDVTTALEMQQAALQQASQADIFIACAAVADYRARDIAPQKIKKQGDTMHLELIKNPDIVAEVAALKQQRPFVVGFAAESTNLEQYALAKLNTKGLDLICANDISAADSGFNVDENAVTIYSQNQKITLPRMHKQALAKAILREVIQRYETKD